MRRLDPFDRLVADLARGELSRRSFVRRAAALGISGPAIAAAMSSLGVAGAAAQEQPKSGGTLRLTLSATADLNPIGVRTIGAFYLQSLMYDGLVISSANWDSVEPALAEKWDISADNKTYTFHLRRGVKWHDGQPFTAADVEFTYKTFLTKAVGSYFSGDLLDIVGAQDFFDGKAQQITGIKVIDDNTISFTLTKPRAPFVFAILTQHSIIPMHVWKDKTPEELAKPGTWETKQIGTGPFKFSNYQVGKFLELVRNDDAWRGKPYLDKVLFTVVGSTPEAAAAALEKGDIDYTSIPSTEIERMSKLSQLSIISKRVYNLRFLSVNGAKEFLSDKRIHQAIAYGIDRAGLCEAVLTGVSEVANGFSPSAKWEDPNLPKYEYNPEKAKALLKEAGWDSGREFELSVYYNDQGHKDFIAAAQQQLAQIGMKAKVVQLDASAVQTYYYAERKFDVMLGGFAPSPDMDEYAHVFSCDGKWPAGQNAMLYCNPKVDQLFQQGAETLDDASRKKIYDEIQAILMDDLPWIPVYFLKLVGGVNKRVQGPTAFVNGWNRPYNWSIEKVWVNDGK